MSSSGNGNGSSGCFNGGSSSSFSGGSSLGGIFLGSIGSGFLGSSPGSGIVASGLSSSSSFASDSGDGKSMWTHTLYYTPHANNPQNAPVEVGNRKLISYFENEKGTQESVQTVWIYKIRIGGIANPLERIDHHFLVVQSAGWFWSLEKDNEGIRVQRAGERKFVQEMYRGKQREPLTLGIFREFSFKNKGRLERNTTQEIFNWIHERDILNEGYCLMNANCQHFAKNAYKAIVNGFDN